MRRGAPALTVAIVGLLAAMGADAGTDEGATARVPTLSVELPRDESRASRPLHVRFTASAPCRSALAVDGLVVSFHEHLADGGLTAEVHLPSVSLDRHTLSLDVVDASGNILRAGPRWSVDMEDERDGIGAEHRPPLAPGAAPSVAGEAAYGMDEPVDPYDPNMTQEEMAQATLVDGWWLVTQTDFEFTRPEPADSCEDIAGWRTRSPMQGPRRVWDAFQLFNELDMLEVRLTELDRTVHRFVIVEATRTHSNQPKPLHFAASKHQPRFARFLHKIEHVIVDDLPNNTDAWVLENYQRNAVLRGLKGAHPNDLVVIADVDEIPVPYVLNLLRHCDGPSWPVWLYSRFFNFRFSFEFAGQWKHPQVVRAGQLALPHLQSWHAQQALRGGGNWTGPFRPVLPQQVRMGAMRSGHTKIESGGWHCSFFTDADGVLEKVAAFTHQELNVAEWRQRDAIAAAIETGEDYFNADMSGRRKNVDRHGGLGQNPSCHGLPRAVLANPERFHAWLPDCHAAHGPEANLPELAFSTSGACPSVS